MTAPLKPENNRPKQSVSRLESGYMPALRVTVFYVLFSGLWILLSDQILATLVSDPVALTKIQTYKGEFFVTTSAVLIYFLLRNEIHRRDQVERFLWQSEEKYRQLVEQASDGIFITDETGCYIEVNPSGCEMTGYTRTELIGMHLSNLLPEEELKRLPPQLDELKKGKQLLVERKLMRKDGSTFFVEISAKAVGDGRLQGIVRDISARVEAEARIRQWADIFEHTRMGLAISNSNNNWFDLVNPAYAEMHNYQIEELLDKPFSVVYPPERFSEMESNLQQSIRLGHHIYETVHRRKDGSIFPVLVDATVVSDPAGERLYTIASVQDISERKKSEQRIQSQLERLGALRKVDLAISARLELSETLKILIDQLAEWMQVEAVLIYLTSEEDDCLILAAGYGVNLPGETKSFRLSELPNASFVLEQRRFLTREDIDSASLPFERRTTNEGHWVYHGTPLISQGKVIGVIEAYHLSPCRHDQETFDFLDAIAGQAAIAVDNANLYEGLQQTSLQLADAYDATLEGWSNALELRDQETEGHSHRVTQLTLKLANSMGIIAEQDLIHIRRGTLLHDIGKMGVPDSILLKPGPLTDEEWRIMRMHPDYAYRMLKSVQYLKPALDIPYSHHEWWNGKGYPRGLKGEEIPLAARIFAVVDVWDALRSDRSYRPRWSDSDARQYIESQSGIQFDPEVVKRFLEILSDEEEPKG